VVDCTVLYDENVSEETLRKKFRKGKSDGEIHTEGRDNSGKEFNYKKVPDRSDLAAYIRKLSAAILASEDRVR